MKDKSDKLTPDMWSDVIIPIKLSRQEMGMFEIDAMAYHYTYPELRLGQAFCNVYKEKYHEGLHYPELWHAKGAIVGDLIEAFLIKQYPVRKT